MSYNIAILPLLSSVEIMTVNNSHLGGVFSSDVELSNSEIICPSDDMGSRALFDTKMSGFRFEQYPKENLDMSLSKEYQHKQGLSSHRQQFEKSKKFKCLDCVLTVL